MVSPKQTARLYTPVDLVRGGGLFAENVFSVAKSASEGAAQKVASE